MVEVQAEWQPTVKRTEAEKIENTESEEGASYGMMAFEKIGTEAIKSS